MKIHRFFINAPTAKDSEISISDEALIHQIRSVLKMRVGERIALIVDGQEGLGEISSISAKEIIVKEIEWRKSEKAQKRVVTVAMSIIKGDHFDNAIQKLTECGATNIIPLICERTVKKSANLKRIKKIALEASEQCGRLSPPLILEPMTLPDFLKIEDHGQIILLNKDSDAQIFELALTPKMTILVGPEGGFTDKEIELAKHYGALNVKLSENTLRAGTAAEVATFILAHK